MSGHGRQLTYRLAAALLVLGLAVTAYTAFAGVGTTTVGDCGSIVDPGVTQDEIDAYRNDPATPTGPRASMLLDSMQTCVDALDDRRRLALVLLVASFAVPAATAFVGRALPRD